MAPALVSNTYNELAAIASNREAAARSFQRYFGVPEWYTSYQRLLDSEIDAVYIALPNALHYEWALKALAAGKHVLCEKPLALNI